MASTHQIYPIFIKQYPVTPQYKQYIHYSCLKPDDIWQTLHCMLKQQSLWKVIFFCALWKPRHILYTCPVMFIFPLPDISNKSYVLVNSLYVYIYRLVYLWLLLIIVEWLSRPIEQFLELEFNIFQCKVCNHLYSNS